MDGTLVDSTPAVVRSWMTWAQERGIPAERLLGWHGVPAASIVTALVPPEEVDDALARITELEVGDVADIVVLPGVLDAFDALVGAHFAIATSCTRDLADARIGAAQLPSPEVVVTVDDVTHGKPDPEPFLTAAARLGVDPADCLVVEDAPMGLQAARSAGCATLAVTTTTPAEELDADLVVADLSQVRFEVTDGRIRVQ
ncbi:MAG TPA: HAD-IA family hydrolase [Candidatus Avipropionibacterium avicola]|uniref:HAD-IA family hydrolase n=1 Tax=Candidatus Avipropionibacterium avicola TaxID=2840701 RepID=A0A9D1GY04_9ACTN|nr:HAD-IA family hydrolase [Candidatus Avipropionibacterium avicola]